MEILLIDDGSTDSSGEICQKYAAAHDNIRYLRQENRGVSAARNLGLEYASGDWILFVDGDDFVDREMAEALLAFTDDETDIVCTAFCAAYNKKEVLFDFFPKDFSCRTLEEKSDFFCQLMIAPYAQDKKNWLTAIGVPWGKLYRKSFLDAYHLTFPLHLRRMQDNIFNMMAFYYAKTIRYKNLHLYHYRAEHIQSYNAAYPPQLYEDFLSSRGEVFAKDAFFQTARMMEFRTAEKAELFCASVKNILLTSQRYKDALPKIRKLFSLKTYAAILSDPASGQPGKLRLIRILYEHGMYRCLYFGLGMLWRIKNIGNRLPPIR